LADKKKLEKRLYTYRGIDTHMIDLKELKWNLNTIYDISEWNKNWKYAENKGRFYSYRISLLKELLKQPRNIIEWGTGRSTLMACRLLPETTIDSYEGFERYMGTLWIDKWKETFEKYKNVNLHYYPNAKFFEDPLERFKLKSFDLGFVDGDIYFAKTNNWWKCREEALRSAIELVKRGKTIVMHDVEPQNHWKAVMNTVREKLVKIKTVDDFEGNVEDIGYATRTVTLEVL